MVSSGVRTLRAGRRWKQSPGQRRSRARFSKKHGAPETKVYVQLFSGQGTVFWISDHENLASVDKVNSKIMGDTDYWAAIKQAVAAGLFVESSVKDVVLQDV